jgi:hypothetical protein
MDVRRIPVSISKEVALILFVAAIERDDLDRADQWPARSFVAMTRSTTMLDRMLTIGQQRSSIASVLNNHGYRDGTMRPGAQGEGDHRETSPRQGAFTGGLESPREEPRLGQRLALRGCMPQTLH